MCLAILPESLFVQIVTKFHYKSCFISFSKSLSIASCCETMANSGASQPLLGAESRRGTAHVDGQYETEQSDHSRPSGGLFRYRKIMEEFLCSRGKHFLVMGAVALDVMTLLANIFIQLIACEMHQANEPWVKRLVAYIEGIGLIFSSLFMIELIACLFCFGPG